MTRILWAFLLLSCSSLSVPAAPLYRATVLPQFIDNGSRVWLDVLNNAGQAAGQGQLEAFLYDGNTYTNLGDLGWFFEFRPYGINDRGEVVGTAIGEIGATTAFLYSGDKMLSLPISPPFPFRGLDVRGADINNAGQVLGTWESFTPDSTAFLFHDGVTTIIPPAPGDSTTFGIALNEIGQVTGRGGLGAFFYSNGATILLPSAVGITPESGLDINNSGVVVGLTNENGAFRYENGQVTALNAPTAHSTLVELAINEAGTIVGTSYNRTTRTTRAVVYEGNQPVDLNTLILNNQITWTYAEDINDRGQVLVSGYRGSMGYQAILTPVEGPQPEPVPEPATMALMGAGLLCLLLRHRQAGSNL